MIKSLVFLAFLLSGNCLISFRVHAQTSAADNQAVDSIMKNFMSEYDIPGLSVAITKNGKLVFAKAYGKADVEENVNATTESLFRIASVSKPITAVAIMKMVEKGKLSLDDKVFGKGAILKNKYGKRPYNENLLKLTVRHLLRHQAGGWGNGRSDPMFKQADKSVEELISWTLDSYPLYNAPGTAYTYSNFGYAVLGRVIEKLSGQTYEEFVKKEILLPAGITHMEIGGGSLTERKKYEVTYYGQDSQDPYKWKVSRMDSHGGWIASATDLAGFLVSIDGFTTKPDILASKSIEEMGWGVSQLHNWGHSGRLPGTSSKFFRLTNGYNWVVLCNSSSEKESFNKDRDQLFEKVLKILKPSEIDLFQKL